MDLFGLTEGILVQQVNCKNKMGAGLAKAIYEQYPQVKEDYHKSFDSKTAEELFGTYRLIELSDKLKIANLYTQFSYADPEKPETMGKVYTDKEKLINIIKKLHLDYPDSIIYIPFNIGCGLGGGLWEEVIDGINSLNIDKLKVINTLEKSITTTDLANKAALNVYLSKLALQEVSGKYFFTNATQADNELIQIAVYNGSCANYYMHFYINYQFDNIIILVEYEFSKDDNDTIRTQCTTATEYKSIINKIIDGFVDKLPEGAVDELKQCVL